MLSNICWLAQHPKWMHTPKKEFSYNHGVILGTKITKHTIGLGHKTTPKYII